MDVTAESVISVFEHRHRVTGLRFTYEPEYLRFFQARFAPTVGSGIFRQGTAGDDDADGIAGFDFAEYANRTMR
jgi:hypothetical protein